MRLASEKPKIKGRRSLSVSDRICTNAQFEWATASIFKSNNVVTLIRIIWRAMRVVSGTLIEKKIKMKGWQRRRQWQWHWQNQKWQKQKKTKIDYKFRFMCTFAVVPDCQFQKWSKWVRRWETSGTHHRWQCDVTQTPKTTNGDERKKKQQFFVLFFFSAFLLFDWIAIIGDEKRDHVRE